MKKLIYTICVITLLLGLTACSSGKSAGSYYDDGIDALENGKYEEACKNLKQAILLKNDKAIYYIDYGQALTKLGQYEEAIEQYGNAIVNVNSSITNQNKKRALRGQGVAYYYLKKYEDAVKVFQEALKMNYVKELNTDIRSYLAQCFVKQEKYPEALEVYNALVDEEGTATVYAQRALVNKEAGNTTEAKKDFEKALSLDSKNLTLYLLNYKMLIDSKDEEGANAILKKAAAIKPENKQQSYQLAEVKYYQKDYEGALTILKDIASERKESYRLMGDVYYMEKDYKKAIDNYLLFIGDKAQTVSSTCYLNLSSCYIALKEYEQAQSYVKLGLNAADKISSKELQYNEILIYEQLGDFNSAYEKAKEYVKTYPDDENMKREYEFLSTRYKK